MMQNKTPSLLGAWKHLCELTLHLLVSVLVLIWEVLFCSCGGFGGFSAGVEAKGSASSSDINEAAKEETADKVYASYNVRSTPIVCVL